MNVVDYAQHAISAIEFNLLKTSISSDIFVLLETSRCFDINVDGNLSFEIDSFFIKSSKYYLAFGFLKYGQCNAILFYQLEV